MRDYYDEFDQLDVAVQNGRRVLLSYETSRNPEFSWADVRSTEVQAHIANTPVAQSNEGISEKDLLRGIDYWLDVRSEAEDWAAQLARGFLGVKGVSRNRVNVGSSFVDAFISEASEGSAELWAIRRDDPLLYGEICLETSRQISLMLRQRASVA